MGKPNGCDMSFHGSVTVGSKGQVVIPKNVREMLNIEPGDTLVTITKGGKALGFVKSDDMQAMMDYLAAEMNAATK